jgi:hypothetical protein
MASQMRKSSLCKEPRCRRLSRTERCGRIRSALDLKRGGVAAIALRGLVGNSVQSGRQTASIGERVNERLGCSGTTANRRGAEGRDAFGDRAARRVVANRALDGVADILGAVFDVTEEAAGLLEIHSRGGQSRGSEESDDGIELHFDCIGLSKFTME